MPENEEYHVLIFSDDQWRLLSDPNTSDAAIANIVRAEVAAVLSPARARAEGINSNRDSNNNSSVCADRNRGVGEGEESNPCAATTIPPPIGAVRDYFRQKGQPQEEADGFWNYWESRGWCTSRRVKLKNWHSAVATWIRNQPMFSPQQKASHTSTTYLRPDNYLAPTEEERKRNAKFF